MNKANKLEKYRVKRKFTFKQLAKHLQVEGKSPASTVLKWCKGTRIPRPENMRAIYRLTKGQVQAKDFYEF